MNYITEKEKFVEIAGALDMVEQELKALGYWQDEPPAPNAFMSTTPFFMDTMKLHEWLQFVLLFRFRDLMARGEGLPGGLSVFPYAYEFYHDEKVRHMPLLKALCRLDACFKESEE